jgi:hypothetical protein
VAQVPLAEDNDMIKTFPSDRADQPFRISILPWRSWRRWPVMNTHSAKPPGERDWNSTARWIRTMINGVSVRDSGVELSPTGTKITAAPPYSLLSCFTDETYLGNKSVLTILHEKDDSAELKALAAVLNSKLMTFFYKGYGVKGERKLFPKVVIREPRSAISPCCMTDWC